MSFASGTGLISGIDVAGLIASTRQVNSRPISLIAQQGNKVQSQRSALQEVNRALQAFKTAAEGLGSDDNFGVRTVGSTNFNIISPTVKSNAPTGGYSVKVNRLAQNHRIAGQGVETVNATSIAVADGTFEFKLGNGVTRSVAVTTGQTLTELRDAINNTENGKIRASIVNDGSATNPYRLVLTSTDTGAANEIKITNNDTTLNFATNSIEGAVAADGNGFDGTVTSSGTFTGTQSRSLVVEITSAGAVGAAGFRVSLDGGLTFGADNEFTTSAGAVAIGEGVEIAFGAGTADFAVGDRFTIDAFNPKLQQAQDALIEVDGIQISRANNTFEDVIDGVTLTAKKVDEEAQTVTVSADKGALKGKVEGFVKAYNELVDVIAKKTAFDVDAQQAQALFGDSGVNSLLSGLRSITTGIVPGISGNLNSLSRIGITVGEGGKLVTDAAKLDTAIDGDQDALKALFIRSGISTSSDIQFQEAGKDTPVGKYLVNITQAAEKATALGTETIGATGLATSELLTFVFDDRTVGVNLAAGAKLTEIIAQLNERFGNEGLGLNASEENGQLRIQTGEYGDLAKFTLRSNKTGVGQLGFATADTVYEGKDVAGTINGVAAEGTGQNLEGKNGLKLLITALAPTSLTLEYSNGIAGGLLAEIDRLTDSETGLFATRNKTYDDQLKIYDERINDLNERLDREEERLRATFTALEQKLAGLQQQGNFLASQLTSLIQ